MIDNTWLSALKPGAKVAFGNSYNGRPKYEFDTIERVMPSGQIVLSSGAKFNARGEQIGQRGKFYTQFLLDPQIAEQKLAVYHQETETLRRRAEAITKIKKELDCLRLEALENISAIVDAETAATSEASFKDLSNNTLE